MGVGFSTSVSLAHFPAVYLSLASIVSVAGLTPSEIAIAEMTASLEAQVHSSSCEVHAGKLLLCLVEGRYSGQDTIFLGFLEAVPEIHPTVFW